MAEFDRKALRKIFENAEIEVPKDVLGQICELHTSANEEISESLKTLKANLEKAEHERDTFKAKAPKDGEETISKSEYDKVVADFNDFKKVAEAREAKHAKEAAYRSLIKASGLSERGLEKALKYANLDEIELDENGNIKNADEQLENVKTEWADYIEKTVVKGAQTATPPANGGKTAMTKADIYKRDASGRYVLTASERQRAIAENLINEK